MSSLAGPAVNVKCAGPGTGVSTGSTLLTPENDATTGAVRFTPSIFCLACAVNGITSLRFTSRLCSDTTISTHLPPRQAAWAVSSTSFAICIGTIIDRPFVAAAWFTVRLPVTLAVTGPLVPPDTEPLGPIVCDQPVVMLPLCEPPAPFPV